MKAAEIGKIGYIFHERFRASVEGA
jgi:hypothetical protein